MTRPLITCIAAALLASGTTNPTGGQVRPIERAPFGNVTVAYRVAGDGDRAVVFIHGYASDGQVWERQLDGLHLGRRIVAVDLVGHGQSEAPATTYSMGYLAASVAAVLDHLHLQRAVVVGWSNGAPVARAFQRAYPARTEALVAIDGPLVRTMNRGQAEQMLAPLKGPDFLQTLRWMTSRRPPGAERLPDAFWQRVVATQLATPQHVLVGSAEAMLPDETWGTDVIPVPVLAIYAKSPMWPADLESRTRAVAPRLQFETWEEASHFLFYERAEEFNALLSRFAAHLGP